MYKRQVYLPDRTLAQDRINRLARCEWIGASEVVVVISKKGCGKSFVVQALGNAACRRLIPVRYKRLARLRIVSRLCSVIGAVLLARCV